MSAPANRTVSPWDGRDLGDLLALDATGANRFATRLVDANAHGRAYGGQVLAQALLAAARTVPAERPCTAMQFMFLQGTLLDQPLDLEVTPLQDGKRFSARHVRGSQGASRLVLDAQVSFAAGFDGPSHGVAASRRLEDPETLPPVSQLPPAWNEALAAAVGYNIGGKSVIDFRLPEPPDRLRLDASEPRLRFWVRLTHALPDQQHLHAATFAYLSDWWVNYAAVGAHHDQALAAGGMYVASLNHALWLHRDLRADDWLHFETVSPAAATGRGLSVARVHDRQGRLVASATQECLMAL